jgi:NAD kinase
MQRSSDNKVVLVTRKTRLEELKARFNTESQAKFYVEHLGAEFGDYKQEHEQYHSQLKRASSFLSELGMLHVLDREFLPNYVFGTGDVVVALGQDGLVANTVKYLDGQPLVGVNPDPTRWEGVLLPFEVDDLKKVIPEAMTGSRQMREITLAKAELNTGQVMYGVNDLFIGPKTHVSIRYLIDVQGRSEHQSSSGVIVSTGLGSTGWFRSLMVGAVGISNVVIGKERRQESPAFPWEADYLYFTVREPWPSKYSQANILFGQIRRGSSLVLVSEMAENGVIFSDGIEKDFIDFNSGTKATIGVAEKKGRLVV